MLEAIFEPRLVPGRYSEGRGMVDRPTTGRAPRPGIGSIVTLPTASAMNPGWSTSVSSGGQMVTSASHELPSQHRKASQVDRMSLIC